MYVILVEFTYPSIPHCPCGVVYTTLGNGCCDEDTRVDVAEPAYIVAYIHQKRVDSVGMELEECVR
jgi:hypothetical protein